MDNRQFDYYQRLKFKIKKYSEDPEAKENPWFKFILLTPNFFSLLCKLAVESSVPIKERVKLASAIAYLMSPSDFLPEEVIGSAGYLDDVAVAAYVLKNAKEQIPDDVLRSNWNGKEPVKETIEEIVEKSEEMLGKELWEKIKEKFGNS